MKGKEKLLFLTFDFLAQILDLLKESVDATKSAAEPENSPVDPAKTAAPAPGTTASLFPERPPESAGQGVAAPLIVKINEALGRFRTPPKPESWEKVCLATAGVGREHLSAATPEGLQRLLAFVNDVADQKPDALEAVKKILGKT